MKKKPLEKRYIVRKYIMAVSAKQAIKLDKKFEPDDAWLDDKWIEQQSKDNAPAIGFSMERNYDY